MADYLDKTELSYASAKHRKAFSLIEVITVLTITAMTMIAEQGQNRSGIYKPSA